MTLMIAKTALPHTSRAINPESSVLGEFGHPMISPTAQASISCFGEEKKELKNVEALHLPLT